MSYNTIKIIILLAVFILAGFVVSCNKPKESEDENDNIVTMSGGFEKGKDDKYYFVNKETTYYSFTISKDCNVNLKEAIEMVDVTIEAKVIEDNEKNRKIEIISIVPYLF